MSENYKYQSSDGERWAVRMPQKEKLKHWAAMEARGYTICGQAISDTEVIYWYEPNGSANAEELGKALVMVNKLGLKY